MFIVLDMVNNIGRLRLGRPTLHMFLCKGMLKLISLNEDVVEGLGTMLKSHVHKFTSLKQI